MLSIPSRIYRTIWILSLILLLSYLLFLSHTWRHWTVGMRHRLHVFRRISFRVFSRSWTLLASGRSWTSGVQSTLPRLQLIFIEWRSLSASNSSWLYWRLMSATFRRDARWDFPQEINWQSSQYVSVSTAGERPLLLHLMHIHVTSTPIASVIWRASRRIRSSFCFLRFNYDLTVFLCSTSWPCNYVLIQLATWNKCSK